MHRLLALGLIAASAGAAPPEHGRRPARMVIRNAIVVEGNGTPAAGPKDILIENDRISRIAAVDPVMSEGRIEAEIEIDAAGAYVLPGLINAHGHIHDERGGVALPTEYVLKLWLACGITTVRDVGSTFEKSKALRAASEEGTIAAPRIFLYPFFGRPQTPAAARARVRDLKQAGADGLKIIGIWRDTMEAAMEEARSSGLRVAHHVGVEETNAWDNIRLGTTSVEHWYGIPDAALPDGIQNLPPGYNYNNEVDRFRYAGRLWREADPARLRQVLEAMAKASVAWDPTLVIYEASRDLQRAMTQPWFREYLHPAVERFFQPNPAHHGSYFANWTSTDEAYWKENYRIWMAALRDFERAGGVIGTGEDAGYIWQLYGFALLRELELHQEAGFHPLKVIQHATFNNARILGEESMLGRVRAGWKADLIVVDGNPLENLKVLYPVGMNGAGGIRWTLKDGIPYSPRRLMTEVKQLVDKGR
ncbi:MAG: amidohydrolase family protein [Bryobacteraceae bacterium]